MRHELGIPIIGADDALIRDLIDRKLSHEKQPSITAAGRPQHQLRQQARYDIQRLIACYPVLPSLEIDPSRRTDGVLENVSKSGLRFTVAGDSFKPGDHLLIAVEMGDEWKFIDVNVIRTTDDKATSTRVHSSIDGPLQRLFLEDYVLPTLDADRFQYVLPYSEPVFRSLCAIGAAQRIVMDQILVCPDCLSMPTTRKGCSQCLSHESAKSLMIHHFACAHVDFVERFDQGTEIACPKCRGRKMIIGADYEYLDGPVECRECGHQNMEEILIGHCLSCSKRFPFNQAQTLEIVGYRVHRLDSLALLD